MFVQVIQAQVSDAAAVREAMERWAQELAPGAEGWLGTTAGVTDDGRFIALARFDSAQAARRNSDRPEQGEWWDQLSASVQRRGHVPGQRAGDAGPRGRPGPTPPSSR